MAERLPTLLAFVWLLPSMSSLMLGEGDLLTEGLPALFTLVGPLARVCLLVVPESRLPAVGPAALLALVRSLPYGSLVCEAP